jgi:hypothetical protein
MNMPDKGVQSNSQADDGDALIDPDNFLWKQYIVYVDLFKFYVDIAWKSTTWYYAITGAILAFYFNNADTANPFLQYALLLPIVLSLGLCVMYSLGAFQTKDLEERMDYISGKLGLTGRPHINILRFFLVGGGILCFVVGSTILFMFVHGLLLQES